MGLSQRRAELQQHVAVHPHVRGAQLEVSGELMYHDGPPPRAWGSAD
ncbi:hypothetical protein B005_4422 [Nocardiopsis alba ATCC BAA-2165]|uniref:Uncharacterized protein n=1 Tax=Nocardiopsis alba (strain ATCC BAA-2165 / BE74) TaxID=1205910 RepID=J7LEQ1_NOCAA|nr:hypothetical protein B005_4422 [Nocardiopsis alba ATCC BAA-2165]